MDKETRKAFADFAAHARNLAQSISQPGQSRPVQFQSEVQVNLRPHGPDHELQEIETGLEKLAGKIEDYLRTKAQ